MLPMLGSIPNSLYNWWVLCIIYINFFKCFSAKISLNEFLDNIATSIGMLIISGGFGGSDGTEGIWSFAEHGGEAILGRDHL